MTDYGHTELISVSCGLNPSPAFQAPSPQVAREKIRSIEDMKGNCFTDKVYSPLTIHLFIPIRTFHFSLKAAFISSKSTLYSLTKLKHFLFLNDVTICILDRIDM